MVETISPVGYGVRTRRWPAAVTLHALGASAAAAGFGALLGAVGALLEAPWGVAGPIGVGALALAYAAREAFGLPLPVPAARRQVPDWWRSFFGWPVAATLYGAGLGIGFLTYLTNGGLVVVTVAAIASGEPAAGALIVGAFGLARGLSPLVARSVRTREAGTALVERLAAADPRRWSLANAAALALVAGGALVAVRGARPVEGAPAAAAAAIAAMAFGWSGAAKLLGRRRWARTISRYALPPQVERLVRAGLPPLELAVPAGVVLGLAPAASALALVLLAGFSAAVLRERIRGARAVACGCFGGLSSLDYRLALGRNLLLGSAAAAAIRVPARGLDGWPGMPGAGEALPFWLATGALLVGAWTAWRATRWLGRGRQA